MLASLSVEDSYFKYRSQIAGTNEVAVMRGEHLVAHVCIVTIFLLLQNLIATLFISLCDTHCYLRA